MTESNSNAATAANAGQNKFMNGLWYVTSLGTSALNGMQLHAPPKDTPCVGVLSFTVTGMHPHDVVTLLDAEGIAVRGGHHCAMPLLTDLGLPGTTRASFSIYNTKEDQF